MSSSSVARRRTRRAAVASLAAAALLSAGAATASADSLEVVTGDLANPRGLTVGPDGWLYVAQAGKGGPGACVPDPEGGTPVCLGLTGAITKVDPATGEQRTVVGRLPSLAAQTGDDAFGSAAGPQDVSFRNGRAWFVVGLGGTPATRASLGRDGAALATVNRLDKKGKLVRVADLAAYEAAKDPDRNEPGSEGVDSNPYSIDATHGKTIVTDAGGNDLLSVTAGGKVKTLALFPFSTADAPPFLGLPPGTKVPVQPVPTGVVRGPKGDAYVGTLTGFPFPPGGANVFRVHSNDPEKLVASGLTNVVDVAFGPDGSLYVLQIAADGLLNGPVGKLVRIAKDGTRTELVPGQLLAPTGLTVAKDGTIYVTNNSTSGTAGTIVKVVPGAPAAV